MSFEEQAYEIDELWEPHWFGPEEHEKVDLLASVLPADAASLLDVGCGNGLFLRRLARPGERGWDRLCGVDRSGAALKHVDCEKHVASADDLPFDDREFDVVTSFDVVEHLPIDVYARTLSEIARVARRYILINVPLGEDLRSSLLECPGCFCRFNVNYHMRTFREDNVRMLFGHPFTCQRVFHISEIDAYSPKVMSTVARLKTALSGGTAALPSYAVCPVCGMRGTRRTESAEPASRVSWIKEAVKRLVPRQRTHRWVAALYERQPG